MAEYGYVGVFFVGGLAFVVFNFVLAAFVTRLIRAHNPHRSKQISYECGEATATPLSVTFSEPVSWKLEFKKRKVEVPSEKTKRSVLAM